MREQEQEQALAELTEIQTQLRLGLRRLAKAVVVVACRWDGRRYAMTATAVSELSFEPPSLLVCVNQTASMHPPLMAGADFSVNILHSSHEAIAALCAGGERGEARFNLGAWEDDRDIPFLQDAQAAFVCRNDKQFTYGTHRVLIGRVIGARASGPVDPLVYVDGRYTTVPAVAAA